MMRLLPILLCAFLGGCVANALCAKKQECDDNRADDDPAVCVEAFNADIDALRANKETECQALADAESALAACSSQLRCADFRQSDLNGECRRERNDLDAAQKDIGSSNQCSSLD